MSKKQLLPLVQPNEYEIQAKIEGYRFIAGVDEAGRGPLAGPVVAAACILPNNFYLPGLCDSKMLTSLQRQSLYDRLQNWPGLFAGVGIVEAAIVDKNNIFRATLQAMQYAIEALSQIPDYVLIDGKHLPSLPMFAKPIIRGDQLSQSIMAASILAKVTRDKIMIRYDHKWPEYGFARHKGYSTQKHLNALNERGPCLIHRRTFAPVKTMLSLKKQVESYL